MAIVAVALVASIKFAMVLTMLAAISVMIMTLIRFRKLMVVASPTAMSVLSTWPWSLYKFRCIGP